MDDLRSLLRKQPMLGELSPENIDALIRDGRQQSFNRDDVLLQEGAVSDSAVLILEGELEVSVQTAYGPVTLTVMSGPALMGEIGVLANLPRTATVRALSAGQALWIDDQLFARLSEDHPAILRRIVAVLGQRIASFNQAIGFYTNALAALERDDLDPRLLDDLRNPPAELLSFAVTFRKNGRSDRVTTGPHAGDGECRRDPARDAARSAAVGR